MAGDPVSAATFPGRGTAWTRAAHDAVRQNGIASGIVRPLPPPEAAAHVAPKKTSYPKQDIRVLLLEGVSPTAVETFRAAGYSQIEFHDQSRCRRTS
jgi:hypothetical protein